MSHDEIASIIINRHTGKPISVGTLHRQFKHELNTGLRV
jgi:hypothetical protein